MKSRLWRVLAIALLASLILSGCGSFTNAEQLDYSETIYADGTHPVGQTYYASFNGIFQKLLGVLEDQWFVV